MLQKPMNSRPRFKQQPRGAVLVLAAILMVVLLGFVAFAVDIGYIALVRAQLQNAADAAAMAGANGLRTSPTLARSEATRIAAANDAAKKSVQLVAAEDVAVGKWDKDTATFSLLSGNAESGGNSVRVTCRMTSARANALQLFFASIFGKKNTDVIASATACAKSSRCGLIIGLTSVTMSGSSHTDSYNAEAGAYQPSSAGNEGTVCTNGDISMSGSTAINGDAHPGPGRIVKDSSSFGVTGETEPLSEALSYPAVDPGNAATTNSNGSIPLSDDKKVPLNSKLEFTLSGGDGVDLPPGTYYFSKLTLSGGSSIRISGKTVIYVTGDCSLSGGTLANQTLMPKNLELYPMGTKCVISGSSEFYGLVYGPTAKVERSGDSAFYGSIVGAQLVLSGSGGIHADESLETAFLKSSLKSSALVE